MSHSNGPDNVEPELQRDAPEVSKTENANDISHVERTLSPGLEKGDHMNYDRVDAEVAKYTGDHIAPVSEEESKRLRRKIDKRVLVIMILTYFLQAIDKGTLSFTSIMGIQADTGLVGSQVR
jgi:hypothetical protein